MLRLLNSIVQNDQSAERCENVLKNTINWGCEVTKREDNYFQWNGSVVLTESRLGSRTVQWCFSILHLLKFGNCAKLFEGLDVGDRGLSAIHNFLVKGLDQGLVCWFVAECWSATSYSQWWRFSLLLVTGTRVESRRLSLSLSKR